jgi:predicted acylesterase/phospholipase RssA
LYTENANGTLKLQEGETYFDGSIKQDIPVSGLAEMLNCQFFIVCQTNPHIVPFFYNNKGGVGRPSRWSSGTQESSWRGGYLLASLERYLKSSMQAKFRFLHDIEAAVGKHLFDHQMCIL